MDATTPKTIRSERSNSASSATGTSPRRQSGSLFESLSAAKRPNDPTIQARRQSLHDQRPQTGIFGTMWHNYVHGANK